MMDAAAPRYLHWQVRIADVGLGVDLRRDTNTLEYACECDEFQRRIEGKLVLKLHGGNFVDPGQGIRDEGHMSLLVTVDLLKVGIKGIGKASLDKIITGEFGQPFGIKLALEKFQGQGIVQDVDIVHHGVIHNVTLLKLDRRSNAEADSQGGQHGG